MMTRRHFPEPPRRVGLLRWIACVACLLPATRSAAQASPSIDPITDLVKVWECRFDSDEWDVNYDLWPDRWTRATDDEHPQYARMQIEQIEGEPDGRRLVLYPDGASSRASSPPIHVLPKFSYKLRMRVKAEQANHGKLFVRLVFQDRYGESKQIELSGPLSTDSQWHEVELGDYQPQDESIDRMILNIDYDRGKRGDLEAAVSVTDVRLYRLPSINIQTGSRYNVYTDPKDVKVSCKLSGILQQNPEIRFQLLDATNQSIGSDGVLSLDGQVISESSTRASEIVDGYGGDKDSYEGTINWIPPIKDYGFYRVKVGMFNPENGLPVGEPRAITIAVVRETLETTENGEFGWSLPHADKPLPFNVLQELLPLAGVNLVKVPVWFPQGDEERGDELVRFAEQLNARGIETIGVLEDPTERINNPLATGHRGTIEGLFVLDPSYWTPLIDHVITKLSKRIRWWQLGHDDDTSFVGYDKLIDKIDGIRNQMFRFGQDVRVGIGWRWDHLQQWKKPVTWDFEQMAGRENLGSDDLESWLAKAPTTTARRWVLVAPPTAGGEGDSENEGGATVKSPSDVEAHQTRVRDFVEQIIVAKVHGVDGIFIKNPFSGSADPLDGRTGVMNEDGTPGELLLPWRTCARLLGGAKYLGAINMPHGSSNWIFRRPDGRVVMVLWNLSAGVEGLDAAPIEEALYLGEEVQVIDVWGKTRAPREVDGRQVVSIGRMPRFVLGLNEAIARWRMEAHFESSSVPSVFGVGHRNALKFRNEFQQGVGGEFSLFVPSNVQGDASRTPKMSDEWKITPEKQRLHSLAAGQRTRVPFDILLRDAGYGVQPIRIDFNLTADREYRFSVWRTLSVGLGDLDLDVVSHLEPDGRLVVEQRMSNRFGAPADFKCVLYAHGRRRRKALVFQLGPDPDKKKYTYVDGESLIGQVLKLRVEQVDGSRVMIHRFIAEPTQADDERGAPANTEW